MFLHDGTFNGKQKSDCHFGNYKKKKSLNL